MREYVQVPYCNGRTQHAAPGRGREGLPRGTLKKDPCQLSILTIQAKHPDQPGEEGGLLRGKAGGPGVGLQHLHTSFSPATGGAQ